MATTTKTYEYAVRDRAGKIIKGRVDAPNESAVANRLKELGLAAVSISEVTTTGLHREITIGSIGKGRVKLKDLAVMARQMATMVSAGLSLLRTLSILADQTENKTLADVLAKVRADVEQGRSLADAFERHPDTFPPLMVNMIRAGEVGGFLEESLLSVAGNYEAEVKLRNTVKSAMTYPVVVLCIAVLAVIAMLVFIVPVFEKMFADLGGQLPFATQILVVLSKNMVWIGPVLLVAVVGGATWWRKHKNDESVRSRVDPWKLKAPVFGTLVQKIALARFTRNFGTMIRAGVPLLQALDIVKATSGNWVIEKAVEDVQESVRRGDTLARPLGNHEVFPAMVTQMIAVGEDAGALDTMLGKVSQFYDEEVEATTQQLTSMIEPIMIVVIGSIVGGMIVALYLPMFSVFEMIS